jgi:hypothetical protein
VALAGFLPQKSSCNFANKTVILHAIDNGRYRKNYPMSQKLYTLHSCSPDDKVLLYCLQKLFDTTNMWYLNDSQIQRACSLFSESTPDPQYEGSIHRAKHTYQLLSPKSPNHLAFPENSDSHSVLCSKHTIHCGLTSLSIAV